MKVSIELTDEGELTIETDSEDVDVLRLNALLDIAKLNLVTGMTRSVAEMTTPEDSNDEVSV